MREKRPHLVDEPKRARQSRRDALRSLAAGVATFSCSGDGSAPTTMPVAPQGAAPVASPPQAPAPGSEVVRIPKAATDRVPLGNTGIEVTRLALGSGSWGGSGTSDQTKLGVGTFATLLEQGHERGITFWETADAYGCHEHVGEGMRRVGRQNVVLLTKSVARTAEQMQADLARFQQELGTDYLDVVLLHQCEVADWTTERAGAMEVLSEAKRQGIVRAHGVSCHTLVAQQLAATTDWVDVDLARVNPFGSWMDGPPEQVIPVLDQVRASGTGVIGMKILGLGDAMTFNRFDEAIAYAVNLSCLDCFTIGFTNVAHLDEVIAKIAAV